MFDLGGNKYRLIAVIHFDRGKLFVRHVLTHAEYEAKARGSTGEHGTHAGNRTSIRAVHGRGEDRYLDLVRRFPLRTLRSDADLDAAITRY